MGGFLFVKKLRHLCAKLKKVEVWRLAFAEAGKISRVPRCSNEYIYAGVWAATNNGMQSPMLVAKNTREKYRMIALIMEPSPNSLYL